MNPTAQIEWRSAAERVPTAGDSRKYLVCSPGSVVYVATRERDEEKGDCWLDVAAYSGGADGSLGRYVLGSITHWAELPKSPARLVRAMTGPEGVSIS
jgi:hypothetical protein